MARKGPQSPLILGAGIKIASGWPEPRPGPLDLSPDGAHLAYAGVDGDSVALVCREVATGQPRWRAALSGSTTSLRYSPDGARLAASSLQGHVAMLDAATGRVLGEHRVDPAPRRSLSWSPDGSRVLSSHGHSEAQVALLDREGARLAVLELPRKVSTAAFISEERVAVTEFQSEVSIIDLPTRAVVEELSRPGFEIGVAANRDYLALTRDHGHLLLRRARAGVPLPDAAALKAANKPTYTERMARNDLRLEKIRDKGTRHTLGWEKNQAETVWRRGSPAAGWELWLPLPHGQIQNMRFLSAEGPLLLLCDGRDASLLELGATVRERLLLGLFPVPGNQGHLVDVAYRAGLAAVSISSWNPRLQSQVLVLDTRAG
jgi:hypothetical protein